MDRYQRARLCDQVVGELRLPPAATYRDACYRVGEVMSHHLGASVELRFVALRNSRLSGGTALRPDGTYVIFCVNSRFWYHRLGILLHELAHLLLKHEPIVLTDKGLRRFAPHLPERMISLMTRRALLADEEREAEELADDLLGRLIDQKRPEEPGPPVMTEQLMRIAEGLNHPWVDRPDGQ